MIQNNLQINGLQALPFGMIPAQLFLESVDPTSANYTTIPYRNFQIGTFWLNTTNNKLWYLASIATSPKVQGNWIQLADSSGVILRINADTGFAVPSAGVINLRGDPNITTTGSGNTITTSLNQSVSISGSMSAGTVTSTSGNITSAANFFTASGDIVTGTGNISAGTGHISAGDYITAINNISTLSGNIISLTGAIEGVTGLTISDFGYGAIVSNVVGVFSSTNGTAGQVLTANGAGASPTFQNAAAGAVSSITLTLTNAQIKNLFSTPVTIIPAAGAGTTIWVIQSLATLNYGGSNAFVNTSGDPLQLYYTSNASANILTNGLLTNAQIISTSSISQFDSTVPVSILASTHTNAPVVITQGVGASNITGNAANDNTITVSLLYMILTL